MSRRLWFKSSACWRPALVMLAALVAWAALSTSALGGATALAAPEGARLRVLFQRAGAKYQGGDYAGALVDYEQALRIRRHPSIVFNIGQCHRKLGHDERARYFYRLYLAEWEGKATPAPHLREVLGHIRRLTARIERRRATQRQPAKQRPGAEEPGRLSLDGLPFGAVISVDGVERGRAPLAGPLELDPGSHEVRVEADGRVWRGRVEIAAGALRRQVVPMAGSGRRAARPRGWLYVGIGGSVGAAAMLTLGVVQNVRANATEDLGVYDGRREVALVGYIGAAVLAVGSAVSYWLYWSKPGESTAAGLRLAPSVALAPGAGVLGLSGTF